MTVWASAWQEVDAQGWGNDLLPTIPAKGAPARPHGREAGAVGEGGDPLHQLVGRAFAAASQMFQSKQLGQDV